MAKKSESLTLYGGKAERFRELKEDLEDRLGYEPTYDIRDGVSQFIDWYRDNREWYEPLVRAS